MKTINRINNILNFYKENPNCDPNVFEFLDLCTDLSSDLFVANYKENKQELLKEIDDKFYEYQQEFLNKLLNCGIDNNEKAFVNLYTLCTNSMCNARLYKVSPDYELLKKVGGVSFYILQQQRDVEKGEKETFVYDNEEELNEINFLDNIVFKNDKEELSLNKTSRRELINFINSQYKKEYKIEAKANVKK